MSRRRGLLRPRIFGAPPWSPAELTSLFSWYDADDDDSFTYSSGTTISQWNDRSGNGRHLTAGSANRNVTVNSRDAVNFVAASSHYMSAAVGLTNHISRPFTILTVARLATDDGFQRLCAGFTSGGAGTRVGDGRVYRTSGDGLSMFQGGAVTNGSWDTNLHSPVAVFNGASSSIAVDGGTPVTGNAGTGSTGGIFRVGHYGTGDVLTPASPFEYWNGEICEIAVMTAAITATERASWYQYVSQKWGLTLV